MDYKYSTEYQEVIAALPNEGVVTSTGDVYNPHGRWVCKIPTPTVEVRTALTWETHTEPRSTTITCKKLTGRYAMDYPSGSRESSDGMRPATNGGRARSVFIKDEYTVTLHYTVVVATNNLGESGVYSPELPSPESLAYDTGYGKQSEYTVDVQPTVPNLPTEKVERTQLPQEQLRLHYWQEAIAYFEAHPYVPPVVVPNPFSEGDSAYHQTYGVVKVRSSKPQHNFLTIQTPNNGVKVVMVSELSTDIPAAPSKPKPVLKKKAPYIHTNL